MKCKFCGAEIKKGSNACEYCGSEIEIDEPKVKTVIRESESSSKGVARVVGRGLVSLAFVWAVVIFITLVVVFGRGEQEDYQEDYQKDYREDSLGAEVSNRMPKNKTGMTGQVISCDKEGIATVMYQGDTYENIKILDQDLIEWLNDTDRSIDSVEIRFATDKNGNISELGLFSAGFFLMAKEGEHYTAIREEQVITFTSSIPLEEDHYYGGYFSYPDLSLYYGEEKSLFTMEYMDPKCENKESETEQDSYTGIDVAVYRILVSGEWYYCSKETYDTILIGDVLQGYQLCSNQEKPFIMKGD